MTEWVTVKPKNRKKDGRTKPSLADKSSRLSSKEQKLSSILLDEELLDKNANIHIMNLLEILRKSLFYTDTIAVIKEQKPCDFNRLIVLGLGSFSISVAARLQLALAVGIRKDCSFSGDLMPSDIYDPIMNSQDIETCPSLGFSPCDIDPLILPEKIILRISEDEGIDNNYKTIYYMPHCPYQVYNRLLWKLWGEGLQNIIIIGNSFASYSTRRLDRSVGDCLVLLRPLLTEKSLWRDEFAHLSDRPELAPLEVAFNDLSAMWIAPGALSSPTCQRILSLRPSLGEMVQAAAMDIELA